MIPGNLRERVGHDGAVEDESVPAVLLLDGGLLGEGGGGAVHLRLRWGIHSWNTSTINHVVNIIRNLAALIRMASH